MPLYSKPGSETEPRARVRECPIPEEPSMTTLTKRQFTATEFRSMHETGIFRYDERLELLDGEVYEAAAAGSKHVACVNRLTHVLMGALGDRVMVSVQNSMDLSELSVPEPDLALIKRRADFYDDALPGPGDVLSLIEVSDTTYSFDRSVKLRLYADAGIPEYWIVNVRKRSVDIHRRPDGPEFREFERLFDGEQLTLAAIPDLSLPVSGLFAPLG